MRLLNLVERTAPTCPRRSGRGRPRLAPSRSAGITRIEVGGKRFAFDTGDLSLWELEGGEGPRSVRPSGAELDRPLPPEPAGPRAIVLSVTRRCNLACSYCYVRRRPPGGRMSVETALGSLKLLDWTGPVRVSFFGGEPLLEWDLACRVAEEAEKLARASGVSVRLSMTTNGTLLTRERAAMLARHGFSLIVSLDGPREIHDAERRTTDGAGSFRAALRGLEAAASEGLSRRATLRATFPLDRPRLVRRFEFLNELVERGLANGVSIEPAWPGREDALILSREAVRRLRSEYEAAAIAFAERLKAGRPAHFHHVEKPLERVLLRRPALTECGAAFGYVGVSPEGLIYACHKQQGRPVGSASFGFIERERAEWRDNRWYARRGCPRCWARNACGGGCRAEAVEHTGDIARPWPVECALKRMQVRAAFLAAARAPREALSARFLRRTGERRRSA